MRHVGVLAEPVVRLNIESFLVLGPSRESLLTGLPVLVIFSDKHIAVLVIRQLVVVAEKEDACCKEVHSGCLEKLVASAATFLLALLEGIQQGLSRLTGSCKIVDVFQLYRIDTT